MLDELRAMLAECEKNHGGTLCFLTEGAITKRQQAAVPALRALIAMLEAIEKRRGPKPYGDPLISTDDLLAAAKAAWEGK